MNFGSPSVPGKVDTSLAWSTFQACTVPRSPALTSRLPASASLNLPNDRPWNTATCSPLLAFQVFIRAS